MQNQKNCLTENLARKIIECTCEKGLRIACAESCTGGLIAAALTSISGSSQCFLGGLVAYDPSLKFQFLKIDKDLIEDDKLVSMECAKAMCEGLKNLISCDIAITTTGIAGPSTDSHGTEIGTVYYGQRYQNKVKVFSSSMDSIKNSKIFLADYFDADDENETFKSFNDILSDGNQTRDMVRSFATYHALNLLLELLIDDYTI